MIALNKYPKPQILVDNEVAWTAAINAKVAAGERPSDVEITRYRHRQIKEALVRETNGKCAYCESKLLHIHHGDVEHIYPKSLAPEKAVDWDNLTLACEICNQRKSDADPLLERILDPYRVDPSLHLIFAGSIVAPRGTVEGENTRTLLDLNRGELTERRKEHLESVLGIVSTVFRGDLPVPTRRAIFRDLLARYASSTGPYSAMIRALVAQVTPQLPAEITA